MKKLITLILMVGIFLACNISTNVNASDASTISGNEIFATAELSDFATYTISNANGKPGEVVSVSVHYKTPIAANIAAIEFDFDSTSIEFIDFTFDATLQPYINIGLSNYNIEKKTVVVLFNGDVLYDGVIGAARFKIKDDAPLGGVNIGASPSTKTESMIVVESETVNGEILVHSDVNMTDNIDNGLSTTQGTVTEFNQWNNPSFNPVTNVNTSSNDIINYLDSGLSAEITLSYENAYYEAVLIHNKVLNASINILNNATNISDVVYGIAEYDSNGKMLCFEFNNVTVNVGQNEHFIVSKEVSNSEATSAKLFVWCNNNLKPISKSIVLTEDSNDYYADTLDEAQNYNIEKTICGVINVFGDADIVKYVPGETGVYALRLKGNRGMEYIIFDSAGEEVNSLATLLDQDYMLFSLMENEEYYLHIEGDVNNNYCIIPALPNEFSTVSKNVGTVNNMLNFDNYNVYRFIPSTGGSYIITAVNSSNVKADLFNASFEKVASSDVSDTSVSFRITTDMVANQTYYIIVYPKNETALGLYTLYVEEPFELIAVS